MAAITPMGPQLLNVPSKPFGPRYGDQQVFLKTLSGRTITVDTASDSTMRDFIFDIFCNIARKNEEASAHGWERIDLTPLTCRLIVCGKDASHGHSPFHMDKEDLFSTSLPLDVKTADYQFQMLETIHLVRRDDLFKPDNVRLLAKVLGSEATVDNFQMLLNSVDSFLSRITRGRGSELTDDDLKRGAQVELDQMVARLGFILENGQDSDGRAVRLTDDEKYIVRTFQNLCQFSASNIKAYRTMVTKIKEAIEKGNAVDIDRNWGKLLPLTRAPGGPAVLGAAAPAAPAPAKAAPAAPAPVVAAKVALATPVMPITPGGPVVPIVAPAAPAPAKVEVVSDKGATAAPAAPAAPVMPAVAPMTITPGGPVIAPSAAAPSTLTPEQLKLKIKLLGLKIQVEQAKRRNEGRAEASIPELNMEIEKTELELQLANLPKV